METTSIPLAVFKTRKDSVPKWLTVMSAAQDLSTPGWLIDLALAAGVIQFGLPGILLAPFLVKDRTWRLLIILLRSCARDPASIDRSDTPVDASLEIPH